MINRSAPVMLIAFILLIPTPFTSCVVEDSADVNQDKIYADYELFYNSNNDKTWVVARFSFGGSTGTNLQLSEPASVSFGNDVLPFNPLFQAHFKEYPGRLPGGTFTYINTENTTFENTVPSYEEIEFSSNFDTLSKSSAQALAWDGSALAPNQQVALFIGSWTWGQDALFYQDGDGATDLVMGTSQLSQLATGKSTCYMDRFTGLEVTQGTPEGGRIRGKYRAKNQEVTITE